MSKFTEIKTTLRDRDGVLYGLKELGFADSDLTVCKDGETQELAGWYGHKNPKAEIIIHRDALRKRYQYAHFSDIGFGRTANGTYEMYLNDMDTRFINAEFREDLKIHHDTRMTMKKAGMQGLRFVGKSVRTVNGKKEVNLEFE